MEEHLKLVEDPRNYKGYNCFEKVLMSVLRAKDLFHVEDSGNNHKPTYRALADVNSGKIKINYDSSDDLYDNIHS